TALVQCDDQQNQDEQADDDRGCRNGHAPLTTRERLVGGARLRRDVCSFGGIERRNRAVGTAEVDAVLARNGSHVSALKEQPHGLTVSIGGTRVCLEGSVEDRLTCDMRRRRGLILSRRRGLDSWSCHQNGENHCYKRTCR